MHRTGGTGFGLQLTPGDTPQMFWRPCDDTHPPTGLVEEGVIDRWQSVSVSRWATWATASFPSTINVSEWDMGGIPLTSGAWFCARKTAPEPNLLRVAALSDARSACLAAGPSSFPEGSGVASGARRAKGVRAPPERKIGSVSCTANAPHGRRSHPGNAGAGGDGVVSAGESLLSPPLLRLPRKMTKSFGSQIRPASLVPRALSTRKVLNPGGALDVMVALNWRISSSLAPSFRSPSQPC